MSWLEFISSMVASLAWPVFLTLILVVLKKPLLELISALKSLRFKDIEFDFGRRVEAIEKEAEEAELVLGGHVHGTLAETAPDEEARLQRIAELSPRAAIVEAWIIIEEALQGAALRLGINVESHKDVNRILVALGKEPTVNQNLLSVIREMRSLRNDAAHVSDCALTVSEAQGLVSLAFQVAEALGKLAGGPLL
jgi:hypothetical protein